MIQEMTCRMMAESDIDLVERGRTMGYDQLYVGEIYDFNIGSQKCFESVGFRSYEKTEKGSRYVLKLK